MNEMLQVHLKLSSECNGICEILEFLGSGTQGEVYRVRAQTSNNECALKWYFPQNATKHQKKLLKKLIAAGAPDPSFLWPFDLVSDQNGNFGYLMPLREKNYYSINDMMRRIAEPSFQTLCRAGYQLAECFDKLHVCGFSYRDISFGNVYIDPITGNIRIGDNDNVAPNDLTESGVSGTPRFMAPEVVTGEAPPSRWTDLFSLAVLLFYMFFLGHPLDGAKEASIHCLDVLAMKKLYGEEPVFVYDPSNASNRPVRGYHDNVIVYWNKVYPAFLKNLFLQSFTDGLTCPEARVTERQWMNCFAWLGASLFHCPHCSAEIFVREQRNACWCCGKWVASPMRIELKGGSFAVKPDAELLSHHVKHDYKANVIGTILRNPTSPEIMGLRNDSEQQWTYVRSDGSSVVIPPGRSGALRPGVTFSLGQVTATVR